MSHSHHWAAKFRRPPQGGAAARFYCRHRQNGPRRGELERWDMDGSTCICIYIYICMCINMYVCTYVYIYICIHCIHIILRTGICLWICVHVYIYICIYIYISICIYIYIDMYRSPYMSTHMHMYLPMHMKHGHFDCQMASRRWSGFRSNGTSWCRRPKAAKLRWTANARCGAQAMQRWGWWDHKIHKSTPGCLRLEIVGF